MEVKLAYGLRGLKVELPDDRTTVIEPEFIPGLEDEALALRHALRNPIGCRGLSELVKPGQSVAIAVCDVTRAIPTRRILPVLLQELRHVPTDRLTLLIATGTHRRTRPEELREILGQDVVNTVPVFDHDCRKREDLVSLGKSAAGIPVWLNRRWMESDVRVTLGFVEPHFFAGFSGGPKMVAPGLAGLETVLGLHSAELIGNPESSWGIVDSNPIHSAIREIARAAGVHFALDVAINRDRRITAVFAGDLFQEHAEACRFVRRASMRAVPGAFDVVVTTNSGYPLDLNLYQSVKGMSAAARVVREGGAIVCAAECSDGIPAHGEYGRLLLTADSPRGILKMIESPGFSRQDQWQAQIQALIQLKADVYFKCEGLTAAQVRQAHLRPVESIDGLVLDLMAKGGPHCRICVLPEGPQTIPYIT